jgi:hypothetical protein
MSISLEQGWNAIAAACCLRAGRAVGIIEPQFWSLRIILKSGNKW